MYKLLRKILYACLKLKIERYYLFEIDIKQDKLQLSGIDQKFKVIRIIKDNVNEYDFSLFEDKYERLKQRLVDNNYEFYVVVLGKKVCYYTWISYNTFVFPRYVKIRKELSSDAAFLFDSKCASEYRRLGLHSYMNVFRLKRILDSGRNKAFGLVLEGNIYSFKVQNQSQCKYIAVMDTVYCKWLNINKVRFKQL